MTRELIRDQPMSAYIALANLPHVVTSSKLSRFTRSPAASQVASEETDATRAGTAKHTRVLEPHKFAEEYPEPGTCAVPIKSGKRKGEPCGNSGTTTDADGWYCGMKGHAPATAEPPKGTILTPSTRALIEAQHDSIMETSIATNALLACEEREVTVTWEDPRWPDLLFAARADMLSPGHMVCDVKFWADCSPQGFARALYNRGGHVAAHHYRTGFGVDQYNWLACDNRPPHEVAVYQPSEAMLARGRESWERLVTDYDKCNRSGEWPGYESGVIELPQWAGPEPAGDDGDDDGDWF